MLHKLVENDAKPKPDSTGKRYTVDKAKGEAIFNLIVEIVVQRQVELGNHPPVEGYTQEYVGGVIKDPISHILLTDGQRLSELYVKGGDVGFFFTLGTIGEISPTCNSGNCPLLTDQTPTDWEMGKRREWDAVMDERFWDVENTRQSYEKT